MASEHITTVFKEVKASLNDIHCKRKRSLFFQKIMWVIAGVYFLLMFLNMLLSYFPMIQWESLYLFKTTDQNPYANIYPLIIFIILLYPALFYFSSAFKKYEEKKQATISQMVKLLFPKIDFAQGMVAPRSEITDSKIFAWIDKSTMIANYGQIRSATRAAIVHIADIGILEENAANKLTKVLMMIPGLNMMVILWDYAVRNIFTSKTADNVQYTFRGMFSWLVYPKKLNGYTVVLTNKQKLKFDRLASFQFKEEQKVLLEDIRFTDRFVVYSTDQVEARYVLSTALMERIAALEEKFNRAILLSFHSQKMYLAVENTHGLFSFPTGKLDNIKIVEELVNDIETALDISQSLKLG